MYHLLEYLLFWCMYHKAGELYFSSFVNLTGILNGVLAVMLSFSMSDFESACAVARQGRMHEMNATLVDVFREDEASSLATEAAFTTAADSASNCELRHSHHQQPGG